MVYWRFSCLNLLLKYGANRHPFRWMKSLFPDAWIEWKKCLSPVTWKKSWRKNMYLVFIRKTFSDFLHRVVRGKIIPLIEQWQRICILAERIVRRREAAAVRSPPALSRAFLPTHFTFPNNNLSPASTTSSLPGSPPPPSMTGSLTQSFMGLQITFLDNQSDLSRLTNTLRAVIEVNESCWRGDSCELSDGVRAGLEQVAAHTQRHSEISELRVSTIAFLLTNLDLHCYSRERSWTPL